jgi:hypothetical protein
MLGHWWVIAVSGLLFIIDFVARKISEVDSVSDAVHTFIPIPAGAVLAAAAFGQFENRVRLLAFRLAARIALTSHGTKAEARLAVNASPEHFSNIALSTLEDAGSIGLSLLVAFHPVMTPTIVRCFSCRLEQNRRAIKRRINAKLGFRSFDGAWRTIQGYEAIHMIRKGQVR